MAETRESKRIDEIVFSDDFFRASENNLLAAARSNRKFLRGFFGVAASRLGWRVREVCPQSQGGNIAVPEIMEALGLPQSPQGWAAACTADLSQAAELLGGLALTSSTLLIGWGLSPSILQYVEQQGAAFIDVEIHPIRFARDLHLTMRTNDPGIYCELERLRVDEDVFWSAAAGLRGYFARRGESFIVRSDLTVGLFVGQMTVDLAAVSHGRLTQPADFVETLVQWAQEVDLLLIRPHPAETDTSHLYVLLDSIPNATIVNSNTYSLLCAENLTFVAAASSGVLDEAAYLGCGDIRRLLIDDRNSIELLPATCSPWIPVRLEVASARSLEALQRARQHAEPKPGSRRSADRPSAFPDDMLNPIFSYRWGLDLAASGLPELPTLEPGQSLSLAAGTPGAASVVLGRGWHSPEHWGVWSAEDRACLVVSLKRSDAVSSGGGVELCLYGHLYAPQGATPPAICIMVNDHDCQAQPSEEWGEKWIVHLDANAIKHRLLIISISVQGALRPCDVDANSNDVRAFGIGLRYLTLRESERVSREFPQEEQR